MRCTSCYLLVAALLLAALLFGNPLPHRVAVVHAPVATPAAPPAPTASVPSCPDPALADTVVRHEVRAGQGIWWLRDGSALVVRDGRAQRVPVGADPLAPAALDATLAAPAAWSAPDHPAPAGPEAVASEPGHDPR